VQEVADSERRFRAIFDGSYQFVGLIRPDGTIIEINRKALKQAGVTLADVVGKALWDGPWWRFSAEARKTVKGAVERAATGAFVRHTVDVQGSTGMHTIDFSLMPVLDDAGRVVSIIPEGRDITELMRATAALRLSEARLAKAQRMARIGYIDWSRESGITYWSDEIYRILGIAQDGAKPFIPSFHSLLDLVHPADRDLVKDAIRKALSSERAFDIHHRIVRPDGTERILHVQAEVIFDDDGVPTRLTGMAQDVTESKHVELALRMAKEEAEQANRAKSSFLANMSHELRTPLNAVIGFAEMMEMQTFGPLSDIYLTYAHDIRESGRHLLTIINDILDMSKIEAGRQPLHESDVSIPTVIAATLRLIGARAEEAGIEIAVRVPPDIPWLRADERLLKQMLLNLVSNAVKFTPVGGRIVISAAITGSGMLAIAVADTGIGMDPKDIPTALAPFGQIDSALNRKFQGTGLGLPLVKSLAELHGGALAIESAPGAGTTVTLRFPGDRIRPAPSVAELPLPAAAPPAAVDAAPPDAPRRATGT
ncbi:MAG: PAS domain-containing sensor histidine kinase, partial [Candidatus Eiseniibacteriota bacterium]